MSDLSFLFGVRELAMVKMPVWCVAAGLFIGAIALAEFVAPGVLEKLSLGPFKDKVAFGPLDPLSQPHPLSQRLTSLNSGSNVSRFEFYPWDTLQREDDRLLHQRLAGRRTPRIQDTPGLSTKPRPALVRQPFLVPHVLANIPPSTTTGTIRALQRELKRVGCYSGKIDGDWGPASRYAAVMFAQSTGLALPLDKPYEVMLARSRQRVAPACNDTDPKTKERMARQRPARQIPSATSPRGTNVGALEASTDGTARRQNRSVSVGIGHPRVQLSSWRNGRVSSQ